MEDCWRGVHDWVGVMTELSSSNVSLPSRESALWYRKATLSGERRKGGREEDETDG